MQEILFMCVPVDSPENRAYYASRGCGELPWPEPYGDSVRGMFCEQHGGEVWIGPEQARALTKAALVLCHLCAAEQAVRCAVDEGGEVVIMVNLSDKKAGPG